ncbi:MAG: hypothetical protein NUV78_02810 [Candidatus Zambryskibacteria bacterium]|nr:hypothetical protein [Candidatus Zambryskibacteria bacterium]
MTAVLVIVFAVLVAACITFASYNREVKPVSTQAEAQTQAEVKPKASAGYMYPNRNGRYMQSARRVGTRRGKAVLHVGHPNNATFSRPAEQLLRVV